MSDVPNLYRVKYRRGGSNWKFGIVYYSPWEEQDKKAWEEHKALWVEDAVIPKGEWVYYEKDEIIPIEFGHWDPDNPDEFDAYVQKEYEKAKEKADKAEGLVGKMFNVSVADGYATYVVVKENKKTVKVEWRGYNADRYTDAMMQSGGTFPKDRIEELVRREEGLARLFAAK
jgi:hypothetical protein